MRENVSWEQWIGGALHGRRRRFLVTLVAFFTAVTAIVAALCR